MSSPLNPVISSGIENIPLLDNDPAIFAKTNSPDIDRSALDAAQTKWETCIGEAKELTKDVTSLMVKRLIFITRLECMN